MQAQKIVVIGSTNMDLVVKVLRFPRPGETIAGESFYTSYGGKGANQAVTIARLGEGVAFVGCVGDDAFGNEMLEHLRQEGIDTSCVRTEQNSSSGTALIVVDAEGRNQIIVVRGANDQLEPADIERAEPLIASAKALVIQLEIPLDAVRHAVDVAHGHTVPVILNPAPAPRAPLGRDVLERAYLVVPNEVEAEAMTGVSASSSDFAETAVHALQTEGARKVIITLGEKGCVFSEDGGEPEHVPAYEVKAEDTTGAGDAFVGALAAGYGHFGEFKRLIRFASAVAAISVTKRGAQSSLPNRREVREFLEMRDRELLEQFLAMEQG